MARLPIFRFYALGDPDISGLYRIGDTEHRFDTLADAFAYAAMMLCVG